MTTPDASWMTNAACRGKPTDWWFPEARRTPDPADYDAARIVCARCPVQDACLAHAIDANERDGMWGGTTPEQRRTIRRRNARNRAARRKAA